MIRFVLVGDQVSLNQGDTDFSFWCTVSDKYVDIDGETMFSSLADFAAHAIAYVEAGPEPSDRKRRDEHVRRCLGLVPKDKIRATDPPED